jgi:uncharacterized lipoprotein YmbA
MKKIVSFLMVISLAACTFGRGSEPARFYAISTPDVTQVRGPKSRVNVAIANVSVPQSVDRPQLVIKHPDSNMLTVSEFDRWIEGLPNALPIVISENINMYAKNINARPGRDTISTGNNNYRVSIDFVRFDTEMDGMITVSAWWTVTDNRGDIITQKKTTKTAVTPDGDIDNPDYDAIVRTQSRLIAELSYHIADVISELK